MSEAGGRQVAADGKTIRGSGHWGIENGLHWMPEVNFREDGCWARKDNLPKNLNIQRKIALSRLRAVHGGRRVSAVGLAPAGNFTKGSHPFRSNRLIEGRPFHSTDFRYPRISPE
jgi:hypothetical protein